MPCTESQKRAALKYMKEKTDDIRLRTLKGTKVRWKHYAELAGQSMTAYVCDAVSRQIAFDESGEYDLPRDLLPNLMQWLKAHGHSPEEVIDCISSLSAPRQD